MPGGASMFLPFIMQDTCIPDDQDTSQQLTSFSEEQLLSQEIINELGDCALYSGVGVISDLNDQWKYMKHHLSSSNYKVISQLYNHLPLLNQSPFVTVAKSIACPKPPTAAESSDSPPFNFIIVIFVSGVVEDHTILTEHGKMSIVDDIIGPFLPQSAPHLQHIPKVFFITAYTVWENPHAPPPHFPDDPDGNYCVAYCIRSINTVKWAYYITDKLFLDSGVTVQEAIERSRFLLSEAWECLHYFTCLKNKLVLSYLNK